MALRPQTRRHSANRRGAAAVEFAIVAVPLFLFIFACLEFGRILMCIHSMEEAARVGCRVAVLEVANMERIEGDIDKVLSVSGIKKYTVETVPADITAVTRFAPVTVRVKAAFGDLSWLPSPRFIAGLQLQATCTLPAEYGS